MEISMKGMLKIGNSMGKGSLHIQMVTFMMGCGGMISNMDMEFSKDKEISRSKANGKTAKTQKDQSNTTATTRPKANKAPSTS